MQVTGGMVDEKIDVLRLCMIIGHRSFSTYFSTHVITSKSLPFELLVVLRNCSGLRVGSQVP
jgi:hypothetical protein